MAGDRDHMESMKSRGMTIADDGHGARGHGESFHFADAIFGFDRLVAVEIEPPARAYASIRIGMHSGGAHEIGSHPSQQQSPDYFAFHVLHDLIA
jgi:hypothetical protein